MAYWDGTRWIPEGPPRSRKARRSIRLRLLGASTEAALITLLMFGLVAGTAFAAKGGNGNPTRDVVTCSINGNVVSTTGLPTSEVINFMVTDSGGTSGWALGVTWEGNWTLTVPERFGPTTYEFVSRTYGPGGSKYSVYSSCSAQG